MDPKKLKDLLAQGGKKGGRLGVGLMALAGAAIGIQQSFYTGDISLKYLIYHKLRFSKNLMQPSKIKKKIASLCIFLEFIIAGFKFKFQLNFVFNISVDGGHRSIIFSRIGGVQKQVLAEGLHFR